MNYDAMQKYADALREATQWEEYLIGNLMLEDEAFGPAMTGRADRVESVLKRR